MLLWWKCKMGATFNFPPVLSNRIIVPQTAIPAATNSISIPIPTTSAEIIEVIFNVRSLLAAAVEVSRLRFNGDSGLNYAFDRIKNSGGVISSVSSAADTCVLVDELPAANAPINSRGLLIVQCYNARQAHFKRGFHQVNSFPDGAGNVIHVNGSWCWAATAVITAVSLTLNANNFDASSWYQVNAVMPS